MSVGSWLDASCIRQGDAVGRTVWSCLNVGSRRWVGSVLSERFGLWYRLCSQSGRLEQVVCLVLEDSETEEP